MVYMGIDAGSETVKVTLLQDRNLVSAETAPILVNTVSEVAKFCIEAVLHGAKIELANVERIGITGSSADYVGLDRYQVPVEKYRPASSLAAGMHWIDPNVHTVIDIGANSYMALKCNRGKALKTDRNSTCASGTGRYLLKVSDILGIDIMACSKLTGIIGDIPTIGSTCAVFAETEIISLIHAKKDPKKVLMGVYRGVTSRIYPLVLNVGLEEKVAVTGGVSKNEAMVEMLEDVLGTAFQPVPYPEFVGAIGAGILAAGGSP